MKWFWNEQGVSRPYDTAGRVFGPPRKALKQTGKILKPAGRLIELQSQLGRLQSQLKVHQTQLEGPQSQLGGPLGSPRGMDKNEQFKKCAVVQQDIIPYGAAAQRSALCTNCVNLAGRLVQFTLIKRIYHQNLFETFIYQPNFHILFSMKILHSFWIILF